MKSGLISILLTTVSQGLLFVPLDERFTTRVAFENLAQLTPYRVSSLPDALLPSLKRYADPQAVADWVSQSLDQDAVVSLEMALYGGLIASRVSNDTTE
jgi:hypothetical protein